MEKFIPCQKLSKKEKRNTWGDTPARKMSEDVVPEDKGTSAGNGGWQNVNVNQRKDSPDGKSRQGSFLLKQFYPPVQTLHGRFFQKLDINILKTKS